MICPRCDNGRASTVPEDRIRIYAHLRIGQAICYDCYEHLKKSQAGYIRTYTWEDRLRLPGPGPVRREGML